MAYDGLRPYLQVLEQQGMMRWVDKEVDKDWEISAVSRMIFRAMSEETRYGRGFRIIKGFPGGRVVAGVVASSRKMIATAIGCEPTSASIHDHVMQGMAAPIEPVIVDDGPCKEVIIKGDDVDLNALPIPIWTPEKDAGPYLTPLWVTKDPDDGRRNIGIRRCQIKLEILLDHRGPGGIRLAQKTYAGRIDRGRDVGKLDNVVAWLEV